MTTHKVISISTAPAKPGTPGIGNEVTARLLDGHTDEFFLNDQSTPNKKQNTRSARRSRLAEAACMGSCIEALVSPERKYWMTRQAVGVLAGAAKPPHDAV